MQQLKSLTLEFSSLTSPRNDSLYYLCKDLTSVTPWQSFPWLDSVQSWAAGKAGKLLESRNGKIQPHSGLDGAPGSSLLAAAKAEVTKCQPGPEFLLNASQITQEVHSVIHFAPERTLHTGWVNPAALDSPDIMNTHKKCKLNSLCDKFVTAFPASWIQVKIAEKITT